MPISHIRRELQQSSDALLEAAPELQYTLDDLRTVSHMQSEALEGSRLAVALEHVQEAYTLLSEMIGSTPQYRRHISDYARQIDAGIAPGTIPTSPDVLELAGPKRIEKPAEDLTIAERHPDWPPVQIKFYYSHHSAKADMEDVGEHIAQADIVLCENISPELVVSLQAMSERSYPHSVEYLIENVSLDEGRLPLKGSAFESLFSAINASGTHVGRIETITDEMADLTAPPPPVVSKDTYEENLAVYEERARRQAELQNLREAAMPAKFESEVERILTEHPELKDKEDLQVVVTIGAYHTQVQERLDAVSGMPSESYTRPGAEFNPFSEAVFLASKGQKIPKELLERNFMENLMNACLSSFIPPGKQYWGQDVAQYINHTSSAFTSAEMKDIYNLQREGTLTVEEIESRLQAKGLGPMPKTQIQFSNWVWRYEHSKGKQ